MKYKIGQLLCINTDNFFEHKKEFRLIIELDKDIKKYRIYKIKQNRAHLLMSESNLLWSYKIL